MILNPNAFMFVDGEIKCSIILRRVSPDNGALVAKELPALKTVNISETIVVLWTCSALLWFKCCDVALKFPI